MASGLGCGAVYAIVSKYPCRNLFSSSSFPITSFFSTSGNDVASMLQGLELSVQGFGGFNHPYL